MTVKMILTLALLLAGLFLCGLWLLRTVLFLILMFQKSTFIKCSCAQFYHAQGNQYMYICTNKTMLITVPI